MFRRRTDQVYSTLQQVQRRITEQSGGPTPAGGEEFRSPSPQSQITLQPLSQALPLQQPASAPAPAAAPPLPGYQPGKRYVLQLSGDLAMLLMVVWLVSMALMFYLGKNWHVGPGAGLAPGDAGHRELAADASGAQRQGGWVLVLETAAVANADNEKAYQKRAAELNKFVMDHPGNGWKPHFGLRKPGNGSIELIFGSVDGRYGVNKDEFVAFADLLAKPPAQGGAGFSRAKWVQVDER